MEFEPPGLEYVMTAHLSMVPGSISRITNLPGGGDRWSINIAGGTFEGPEMRGSVLPGGIENPQLRPDKVLMINARWLLETDDGARIFVQNRGIRRAYSDPSKMDAWMTKSAPVQASDFYFRVAPVFETSSGKYAWLTRHLFVGVLVDSPLHDGPGSPGPSMRYFKVL